VFRWFREQNKIKNKKKKIPFWPSQHNQRPWRFR